MGELAIFSIPVVLLAACAWGLVCNEWTYRDRTRRLDGMRALIGTMGFQPAMREFDQVSYEQHMWARFTFRDPNKLYAKAGASHV